MDGCTRDCDGDRGGDSGSTDRVAAESEEGEREGEEEGEEEEGLGPAEPDDYLLFQRSSGGRLPRSADFGRAVQQAQAIRGQSALDTPPSDTLFAGTFGRSVWTLGLTG